LNPCPLGHKPTCYHSAMLTPYGNSSLHELLSQQNYRTSLFEIAVQNLYFLLLKNFFKSLFYMGSGYTRLHWHPFERCQAGQCLSSSAVLRGGGGQLHRGTKFCLSGTVWPSCPEAKFCVAYSTLITFSCPIWRDLFSRHFWSQLAPF
jgi:hypothetical protein